jgi:hypothetical protein
MRKDLPPEPVTPVGGDTDQHSGRGPPGHEPQIPSISPETVGNPVYDADLTKEEIVLLASLGIRNPTTGAIVPIKVVAGVLGRLLQKIREQAIEASHENKDSIELSRNAKEEYAYKIKVYLDAWKAPVAGIALIESMNKEMLTRYARAPRVIEK